jgi:hypothetical protein
MDEVDLVDGVDTMDRLLRPILVLVGLQPRRHRRPAGRRPLRPL